MSTTHFALDIGTRTVVGLIVEGGEPLEIKAACILEHDQRSMHGGQIHDVDRVAELIRKVKNEPEGQTSHKLIKTSVAVAGRALRISGVKTSIKLPYREITEKDILRKYADITDLPWNGKDISVILNKRVTFGGTEGFIQVNGKKAIPSEKVLDGDNITLIEGSGTDPILSDLFEYMDIRREELVGKSIRLFVNDHHARFTTPLKDGDRVTIEFPEV